MKNKLSSLTEAYQDVGNFLCSFFYVLFLEVTRADKWELLKKIWKPYFNCS
jgi:hypothetical protein